MGCTANTRGNCFDYDKGGWKKKSGKGMWRQMS